MKEIKFRMWCKNKNEWEKDLWWIGCDGNLYCVLHGQLRDLNKDNHILMQFTGLCDKNSKEIYEGDILKQHGYSGEIGEVMFGDGRFYCTEGMDWGEIEEDTEVVGNIYENPELLEVK